tara:strand:+ start:1554 stop:2729 length:1176 start_codon:yes stop_codon:yes gene_type:complete
MSSSVIQDLEKQDYQSRYQQMLDARNAKNSVTKLRELWSGLNDYFVSLHEKVLTTRSTFWYSPTPVTETNKYHSDDGGYIDLPIKSSMNHIQNVRNGRGEVEELEFVPFAQENIIFEIATTKSSIKKGVFNHWLENPPKGYAVVTHQVKYLRNGPHLCVHLSLEDGEFISQTFKDRVRVYSYVNALTYCLKTSEELTAYFKEQCLEFCKEIKLTYDPNNHYCKFHFVNLRAIAIQKLNENIVLFDYIIRICKKMLSDIGDVSEKVFRKSRVYDLSKVDEKLPTVQDFIDQFYGIPRDTLCNWDYGRTDGGGWSRIYANLDEIGVREWEIDNALFSGRERRKVARKLQIVGSLSHFERYISQVLSWSGNESDFSDAVGSCFIDEDFEMENKY